MGNNLPNPAPRWSRSATVNRIFLPMAVAALVCMLAGCTFAQYSKLHVRVVDEQTLAGIPKARVRTYYIKPMFDMTYQRKDREKTDADGYATLTVATNWSQRMILGWTHGISPCLSVVADGYRLREIGIRNDATNRAQPLLITMERTK